MQPVTEASETSGPDTGPILSVLIVTYQSSHEIGECLASIPREIGGRRVEVIVADNFSTDGTADFVAANFPDVRLLALPENCGFSKANNRALDVASGTVILYLNPDTLLNTAAISSCLDRLLTEPKTGIISPRLQMEDGVLDLACRRSIPTIWDGFTRASGLARLFPHWKLFAGYNLTYLPEEGTYEVGAVNGAFMMIRRELLDEIGALDERFFMYGEDLDLCYRCRQAGYSVVYDGRVSIIHYKGRSSSQNHLVLSKQVFTATEQFYDKHFNPNGSALVRWTYRLLLRMWYLFSRSLAFLRREKTARPL
jgi:GT2 family glycosyltransferase